MGSGNIVYEMLIDVIDLVVFNTNENQYGWASHLHLKASALNINSRTWRQKALITISKLLIRRGICVLWRYSQLMIRNSLENSRLVFLSHYSMIITFIDISQTLPVTTVNFSIISDCAKWLKLLAFRLCPRVSTCNLNFWRLYVGVMGFLMSY